MAGIDTPNLKETTRQRRLTAVYLSKALKTLEDRAKKDGFLEALHFMECARLCIHDEAGVPE